MAPSHGFILMPQNLPAIRADSLLPTHPFPSLSIGMLTHYFLDTLLHL